ncbi:MAG: hypothetical protein KGM17_02215 [Sphingomonadales bacterium]|nr:hypothetical protein [Sphingomonadales bacterium]
MQSRYRAGKRGIHSISTDSSRSDASALAGLALLYPPDHRPSAEAVARLAGQVVPGTVPFAVTDGTPGTGALELLAHGLTFDLEGLAPFPPAPAPAIAYRYGLEPEFSTDSLAAIRLWPGPHLRGAERLLPVVRTLAGVAAVLTALPGLSAVVWTPARTAMSGDAFARAIANWLAGGAFPALGLTALATAADGRLNSEGLRFFTGQEIVIDPGIGRTSRDGARIAVRLIDALIGAEPVRTQTHFTGPDGEALVADPAGDMGIVRISLAA